MDDVEQVDLFPQGAEKYLLGAAGILPVEAKGIVIPSTFSPISS